MCVTWHYIKSQRCNEDYFIHFSRTQLVTGDSRRKENDSLHDMTKINDIEHSLGKTNQTFVVVNSLQI